MVKINSVLKHFKRANIVVYGRKSFSTYCTIFSIFLSQNIWVPLSELAPPARNLSMAETTTPALILTDGSGFPGAVSDYAAKSNIPVENIEEIIQQEAGEEFILGDFLADDLAYIMFTSGSTGIPKGVPMTNANYINFVENALEILPFEKHEVFSDYHGFSFDISIFYLFCAVFTESAFAPIIENEERFFPLNNIIENRVTVWSSVPSVITRIQMIRKDDIIDTPIKIMFLCGEPFKLDVLKFCYNNLGIKHVYNFYGLTETGVENFYHKCSISDLQKYEMKGFVPIGRPLKGNDILLDADNQLLISGVQVTPGYLGNRETERFAEIDGKRWYKTGDIVQRYEDVYFCKGRMDSQLKLGGYRVELMDIETHIRRYPAVTDAVCFVTGTDSETLVAAVESGILDEKGLKAYLKECLPPYMVPKKLFQLNEFPKNANGKTDRKKIKLLYTGSEDI